MKPILHSDIIWAIKHISLNFPITAMHSDMMFQIILNLTLNAQINADLH